MRDLEPILRYRMDSSEAKAYKIALIWQEECRKEIPNESYAKLKINSDPRKSLLFKYCYKLAKEMAGILQDCDLPLYVKSQIQILKSIRDQNIHALIEPHCLVGDKAWKRWKLWKWRRDKKLSCPLNSNEIGLRTSEGKIKAELSASFDFISRMQLLDFDSFVQAKSNFKRWMDGGDLSCFYLVLSPWIKKIFSDSEDLSFDRVYHRSSINPNIERFFKELFSHEFERNEECLKAS